MNFDEQLAYLDKLEALIAKKAHSLAQSMPQDHYRSDTINDLIASLSKAQGAFGRISFNRKDAYFKWFKKTFPNFKAPKVKKYKKVKNTMSWKQLMVINIKFSQKEFVYIIMLFPYLAQLIIH